MKPITFSIITPSYNQGQFIEETIQSVLNQEGNFYIDYIITDGGSTDNTLEIIKKYDCLLKEKKWPIKCPGIEYRWVCEKDNGQSDAINKGISMTKGEIGAWINSDDCYASNEVLKTVANLFKKNKNVDIVYGNGIMVDANKKYIRDFNSWQINLKDILLRPASFVNQPALFFKKELYLAAGGLDETLNWTMDYDLWFRLFLKAEQYVYIDKTFALARYHADAKSIDHMWSQIIETCLVKKKYMNLFKLSFFDRIKLFFNMLTMFVYYYAVKTGLKKAY